MKLIGNKCALLTPELSRNLEKNGPFDSFSVIVYLTLYLVQTDVFGQCILCHRAIYKSRKSLIGLPNVGCATYWSFDIKPSEKMWRKHQHAYGTEQKV